MKTRTLAAVIIGLSSATNGKPNIVLPDVISEAPKLLSFPCKVVSCMGHVSSCRRAHAY